MFGRRNDKVDNQNVFSYPSVKLKNISCVRCRHKFFIKDFNLSRKGLRIPLLLSCGHALCKNCAESIANLVCNLCEIPGTISNKYEESELPLNIYVLGLIGLTRSRPVCPDDPDLEFYQPIKSKICSSFDKGRCSECLNKASSKCLECNVIFCSFCYAKLHGKALESHRKVMIPNVQEGIDPALITNCPEHVGKPLFIYCSQCDKTGCDICMVSKHNGHTACTLVDWNEKLKPEFDRAYKKVAETLDRVHHTQQKLTGSTIFPETLQDSEPVEAEISQYFAQLHGVLQNIEAKLLDKIQNQRHYVRKNLETIRLELERQEEILREALLKAVLIKDYLHQINLSNFIKNLEEMANMPCHLIKEKEESYDKIRFEVETSVIKLLKNHCSVSVPSVAAFSLTNSENLPPDYNLEPLIPQELPCPWETRFKASNVVSPTPSIANSVSSVTSSQMEPSILTTGSTELIRLAHIEDPSCFYVHQITLTREIDNFHRELENYAIRNNKRPSEVKINHVYIVKFENFWFRGRVKRIFNNNFGQEVYEIFFIDYGNNSLVEIHNMRDILPVFEAQKIFAIKCCLHDIKPKGEKWTREAAEAMNNMISPKDMALTMHVHDVLGDTYSVDICKNTTDKPTSFRDSLIFMGFGTFVTSQKLMKMNPNAVRKYYYAELKLSKYVSVVCSHIKSPDCIYVIRTTKGMVELDRMRAEMTKEYKKGKSKKLIIYSPEVGMTCAAPIDANCWHRAIITDLPCEKMVEVFYVDIGLTKVLPFNHIRKMQQKYMNYATQAVEIKLRDLAPLPSDRGKWSANTIDFVKLHLSDVKVKVVAFNENEHNKGFCKSYSACLYTMDETNFGALLVSAGHAISTGVSSQCSRVINREIERNQPKSTKTMSIKTMSSLSSVYGGSTISLSSSRSEKILDDIDPFKFRVLVLNAKSPDCIYVADPSRQEINSLLSAEMQTFYNRNSAILEDLPMKDQMYAVYSTKDKAFFRARIMDIKSESEINVFFIDMGVEETVSVEDIQPLDKKFLSIPRYQFKVKLAGITPCGGSSSWPSTSCEQLRDIIFENENCKFFISKVGETVDDAIPVELWVKQSKTEGPLEPTKIEMNSVGRILVARGYALPVKNYSQNVKRTLAVEFKRQLNKSEESINCMSEIAWSVREGYEDTLVDSIASSNSQNDDSESDTLSEVENVEIEEESSSDSVLLPPEMSAWLPPAPIRENSFIAVPTYIDNDCFVYLHPNKGYEQMLKKIEAELDKRYRNAKIKSYDKVWKEGDMCVAQYHLNKKWYRGLVKKVHDSGIVQVEFVDYGNVEDCQIGTLKKRVILGNIPIQCTKCVIHGLYPNTPDGIWSTQNLDTIHTLLVDQKCEVTVLDRTGISPQVLHISITLLSPDRRELISFLQDVGMNIQNPNGSCTESEASTNSMIYKNTVKSRIVQKEEEIEDVVIECYLRDCETFPQIEVFTDEGECIGLTSEEPNVVPKTLKNTEIKDPVIAGKIQHSVSVKMNNESETGVASSLESLSWNDIVNKESRLTTSTPQVDISTSSSQTESNDSIMTSGYKDIVDLIEGVKELCIDVTHISRSSLTVIHAHLRDADSEVVKMYVKQYENMCLELLQGAEYQPLIEHPETNMPCLALYQDEQWYRGLLVKCELNPFSSSLDVTVRFVDFGNEEIIETTRLRQIDEKWMSIPAMSIKCRLYNLVPGWDRPKLEMAKEMIKFLEKDSVFAKINERHKKTLDIELFSDKECTNPALTALIEKGLFKLKTKKE